MTTPFEAALNEGYTPDEINAHLAQRADAARAEGYSDGEIQSYIDEQIKQKNPFNTAAVAAPAQQTLATRPSPKTLTEAISTGWGWSTTGLATEMTRDDHQGRLPATAITSETPFPLAAAGTLAGMAGDLPAFVTGMAAGGGPASPITAVAGGMGLTSGLRKVFIDALTNNEIETKQEFAQRTAATMWETAKGWITGAATAGAGSLASKALATSPLPSAVNSGLTTAAELTAMTEVSARLEGHAPEPRDFALAAVTLGVIKAVAPAWTAMKPITGVYEKTGVMPEQLLKDALTGDKGVWQDTLDGRVPDAYKDRVEQPASAPTQAQKIDPLVAAEKAPPGEKRVPTLTPEQQAQARAFMEHPFAEVPQAPNEPSRPTHINYNYAQTPAELKQAHAQLSTIYEEKIKTQQQSPRGWVKSNQDAANVLADLLHSDADTVTKFLKGETPGPSTTAQILARKELVLTATEDLMRARAGLLAKGDAATPEDLAGFMARVEQVATIQAGFLGQRADVGRALNALKSTQRQAERAQALLDTINSYGGDAGIKDLVKHLGEFDNPAQVVGFAKAATKATTREMLVEAWKAGLVSGLRTNEVNFLSTAMFTALKLPTEAIAAARGLARTSGERVEIAEIPARAVGMLAGVRDGFKLAGAILRTGNQATGTKTETFQAKIPGTVGEIVRLPFRPLAASDALLRTINERGELYALATRQAVTEGLSLRDDAFMARVNELAANPTPAMTEQVRLEGDRRTFTAPLGPGGQAFQRTVKEWGWEWIFPFITTPGNIFKEAARMTPGVNKLVREWNADYEAGGIRKDRALAEVAVGSAIMASVFAVAQEGGITGGGQPDPRRRATDRAAGWKPYAVKINGQYYDGYLRMAPIGPLIGLTVDMQEFWGYMTHGERDQWARMLAFAFANNATNQSFFTGATNMVNVLQDPSRYGQNYFESLAGSIVPSLIGQTTADQDPYVRQIQGMRDAIQARIPVWREGLMPQRDLFGQPIPSPERLWMGSPFTVSAASTDKVRTEASRVGFASPVIPKSVDVVPGVKLGATDTVQLTPEQRDIFNSQSGQLAHAVLEKEVASPGWDGMPLIIKRQLFEKAFKLSRDYAQTQLLLHQDPAVTKTAVQELQRRLKEEK